MLWRGPERDVIPASRELGISQIVWSPLAQGVLTGQVQARRAAARGDAGDFARRWAASWTRAIDQRLLERVQELRPVADELGLSMAQLALAWVLREENVASAIIGASRPEQVEDNAGASGVELDAETLARIDEILGDSVAWEGPAS